MLVIRREQMAAFSDYVLDRFVADTVARLGREQPALCARLERAGTTEFVRAGIARAEGYGIETEGALGRFIDLMAAIDPAFETLPDYDWTLDILEDDGLDGNAKVGLIESRLRAAAASGN